ncbi:succinyl-CoA synthetase-like protein [Astrocystis sublimbata]|nr:succinyl-CoA synthetase-like protein [Astrocystis sublimbata]
MRRSVIKARGHLPERDARVTPACQSFSSPFLRRNYGSTLTNLKIGRQTRVIFQGFTGKQATANAKESIEWGTNIVGGVRPGFEGEHLGLPVLPTVKKAMEILRPDATGIYVAAHQATAAIHEAIEAEVPLIIAVAEHIPLHDLIRIHAMLKTQSKSRLIGANSPGIISALGKCRIGFQPLPCFEPGRVGIVARSGTLSYETAASTTRSGLGQTMCIGVGGDALPGTTLKEGLQVLMQDQDTEAIALVGEVGGEAEIEVADWIKEYRAKTKNPKPIAAIIGGIQAPPGRIMGHAGAFSLPGEPSAQDKVEALQSAGCAIVNHPARFGPVLKSMLDGSTPTGYGVGTPLSKTGFQRRGIHTFMRRPTWSTAKKPNTQMRSIYLTQSVAFNLLKQHGLPVAASSQSPEKGLLLAVTLNRSTSSPCVIASASSQSGARGFNKFDYDYAVGAESLDLSAVASHLGLDSSISEVISSLRTIVTGLITLFAEKEAYLLETRLTTSGNTDHELAITYAHFGFDDAAHRSGGRQGDIQALRNTSVEDAAEVEVEKDGIVYIKLPNGDKEKGEFANIGTLVNGAGLAMNTVDAIADAGGRAANFLDTGGKATSETVKKSFEVILKDPRIKCIFVNIFGGLTLGDMIARGVILAFRDLNMTVPVVVRIRGTNEREGQQIIAESGLPLFAFDDFDEAAKKAIELANRPRAGQ